MPCPPHEERKGLPAHLPPLAAPGRRAAVGPRPVLPARAGLPEGAGARLGCRWGLLLAGALKAGGRGMAGKETHPQRANSTKMRGKQH